MEIRLVSEGGTNKGITHNVNAEVDAEKNSEEKQGTEPDERSVSLSYTGERTKARESGKEKHLE